MRSNLRILALAATVVFAGCGDDDSVSPTNLTEAEATELASAIFSQSFFQALSLQAGVPAQSADGPAAVTFNETVDISADCPLGGMVSLMGTTSGDVDDQTGAGEISITVELEHSGCVVQGDEGTQFTLTGNPNLAFSFNITTDGGDNSAFSGGILGGVEFATSEKDGNCSIDYDFSGEASANGFSFATTGSVCGVDVSQNLTISG